MVELVLPIAVFAATTSITPGPNNVMVTASGANYGFRRTLPHVIGIMIGVGIMLLAIGLGLNAVFRAVPLLHLLLKIASLGFLLWMAWRIATAGPATGGASGRPFTLLQAVAFQWVNPKAWIMVVGAVSTFTGAHGQLLGEVARLVIVFALVGFPCVALWAGFGTVLRRALADPRARRVFNITMAILLVASLLPFVFTT